jgi:hypothetical protein
MADFRSVIEEIDCALQPGESIRPQLLIFFGEVTTASCQWFIKEFLMDRLSEGQQIPNDVKFIWSVNPHRALNVRGQEQLRGLKHGDAALTSGEAILQELIYKVQGVPPGYEHLNIGRMKLHPSITFI